jgi:hypothetical protein
MCDMVTVCEEKIARLSLETFLLHVIHCPVRLVFDLLIPNSKGIIFATWLVSPHMLVATVGGKITLSSTETIASTD